MDSDQSEQQSSDAKTPTVKEHNFLRDAILKGDYDGVNSFVSEAKSVSEFLRPLTVLEETSENKVKEEKTGGVESLHPFDLAVRHEQFKILRALIDHTIRETGVEIFVEILLSVNVQALDVVLLDLIERYPVAAYSLLDSQVSFVSLKGHPVFKEALLLNPGLLLNQKALKGMVKSERSELLRHPLIGTYLAAKWKDLAWIYYMGLTFQIISTLIITTYTLSKTHEDDEVHPGFIMTFRVLGIILTSLRALYMILDASRSILQNKKVLFKPLIFFKEGIFLILVFGGLADEEKISVLRGRATIISWVRLFTAISNIPDRRCLYVRAFKSVVRVAVLEAGIASGIFFPLIGLFLGYHIMSEKGTIKSSESTTVFAFLIIFSVIVSTYLVGLSVAKVRYEVLSITGEDFIQQQKALVIYNYHKVVSFWSKALGCLSMQAFPNFIVLPRQLETDKEPQSSKCAALLSKLKCQRSNLPIYFQMEESSSEPMDFANLSQTKYDVSSKIIECIPHKRPTNASGYTHLYWNNGYDTYYSVKPKESSPVVRERKVEIESDDYEIVEPKPRTKYQLMREAILSEIKRDYGTLSPEAESAPSVQVRPGLALGLITLQASSMGQSALKLNHSNIS